MKITTEDYDVINAYAGNDRSWHDRVSTQAALNRMVDLSEEIAIALLVMVRFGSMEEGSNHD